MAQTRIMKRQQIFKTGIAAGMVLVGFVCLSCGENEPSVIVGAKLSVTGGPNPICLNGLTPGTTSTITATSLDILDGERAGVTVDFTAVNGTLSAGPWVTDSAGVVTATLTVPSTLPPSTATVTATAESLSAALTIPVLDTSSHPLTAAPDAVISVDCADGVVLNGSLLDSAATGVANQVVTFQVMTTPTPVPPALTGTFSPSAVLTDSSGAYTTTFHLNGTLCASNCAGAGPGACSLNVRANANCINSGEVTITTSIP
jgi:hypothetical protein